MAKIRITPMWCWTWITPCSCHADKEIKMAAHPDQALFSGEKPFPVIPSCEHFAGSEKLILKALQLQTTLGPIFDITCDCEDGAMAGQEREHAEMIVRVLSSEANQKKMAGARIHDYTHPAWRQDVDILVKSLGNVLSYITIPKATSANQVAEMIGYIQATAKANNVSREIPIHALIETHGALKQAFEIAALPWIL
jgi:citrate lyase subunit beta/citryl-CoA lyase